ncbi:uncharacterized protein LOC110719898 [Chenopodium quinoa]|uniref:uncharacterized protein LOC110719898 n=1 Tax=Chenopodium quinoa TaxID=63459 RepID=UPI000B799B5E|nr:uncharacterized protein LOC110719898 [Chenopodium quinoa]
MDRWGFWNTRGLSNSDRLCDVLNFIKQQDIGLFGLLETKVKAKNFGKVFSNFGGEWSVCANYSKCVGGRIWVIWRPGVFQVTIVRIDSQCIHAQVFHRASGLNFSLTVVYGFNEPARREELWQHLGEISSYIVGPWMVFGDFNNALNIGDRVGSPVTLTKVDAFRLCLRNCGLTDFKTSGLFYTWNNKKDGESRVFSKIDRVLVNDCWMQTVKPINAVFLPEGLMDHCPCVDVVARAWDCQVSGTAMFCLVQKLKACKAALKDFNKCHVSNILAIEEKLAAELKDKQERLNRDPGNAQLIAMEIEARKQYGEAYKRKISFLKQKSKLHWLNYGDINSAHFHASIKRRRLQNRICNIQNENGMVVLGHEEIAESFLEFYKGLLDTAIPVQSSIHQSVIDEGLVISVDKSRGLCRPFLEADVKKALWDIDDNKAPSPDGFQVISLRKPGIL